MDQLAPIRQALTHGDRLAIDSAEGRATYADLLRASEHLACALLPTGDLHEERIAFLLPGGIDYVVVQWAIWRAGGVAVPLNTTASLPEIEHVLATAGVTRLVARGDLGAGLRDLCASLGVVVVSLDAVTAAPAVPLPVVASDRRAMILFTSGTTNKPKGVVTTHANYQAQTAMLVDAWRWQSSDSIPLFLPLHHVHGIVNVLACALWSGASVEAFPAFDADRILAGVAAGAYTVFTAVPTIYVKLIQRLEAMTPGARDACCHGFSRMRLMMSGSAALPASIHRRWQDLTGQVLLERYGMTEIGMAVANPLVGDRRPGAVGRPLPGVSVRLVSETGEIIDGEQVQGEIQVRGPGVFREYWNDATATAESFTDGWFRTGDMAVVENGYYRILGRRSVDIIKSGGEKLSALEIEGVLLDHPDIRECAVVGVEDDTWGEAVAAAVVVAPGARIDVDSVRQWGADRMARYKLPKQVKVVPSLPRNAMGKVSKADVKRMFKS